MPPLKREDQLRKDELDLSLRELRAVVARLQETVGVPQRAVALASGVNVGFLSQLLDPAKEKTASLNTIRKLTVGLSSVVESRRSDLDGFAGLTAEVTGAIEAIEQRFNLRRPHLSAPGAIVDPGARNYIRRSCDITAEGLIAVPGTYQIDGPPQSGRSSLALRIDTIARQRGHQVAAADFSDLRNEGADVVALAHAMVSGVNPGGPPPEASGSADVFSILGEWLSKTPRRTSLLIIDNVGVAGHAGLRIINQWLRDIQNRRGSNLPANRPFADLSLWFVSSSRALLSYAESAWQPGWTTLRTTWFNLEEVQVLADAYPHASGATGRKARCESMAKLAHERYVGQPLLTHWYVHLASHGNLNESSEAERRSSHLRRVAELVVLDDESRDAVLESTEAGVSHNTGYLEDMAVIKPTSRNWSCPLYRDSLRTVLAARLGVD